MRRPRPSRLVGAFGLAGRRGLALGSQVDLVRSTGIGYAARRVRSERRWGALGGDFRHALYREIWTQAARAAGAEGPIDLGRGFLEIRRGPASTRVWQQVVGLDDAVTLRVALDKPLVHRLLSEAGVPVPEYGQVAFSDAEGARALLDRVGGRCVVKPASGTGGGGGTTAGVSDGRGLERARMRAARFSAQILIERQAEGTVHRLLFLDGELLDVLRHHPPRLVGDGGTSIEHLIARENRRRMEARGRAGVTPMRVNLDTVLALERAGLSLSSVLGQGATVALQTVTNDNRIEDTETVGEGVSPELIEVARRAVAAVGLRLAGADVITTDIARPLAETGGVVTEVNGHPGLHHHYLVADPELATPVAVPILERLLAGDDERTRKASGLREGTR